MPKARKKPAPKPRIKSDSGDIYQSEIRKHYFLDRYVIVSPKRNLRPDAFAGLAESHATEVFGSPALEDERSIYEITDSRGNWLVKVVANAFPALKLDNQHAFGKQEVVVETPEHNVEFSALPLAQIDRVFNAYIQRIAALSQIPGIAYVAVFKNDGPKAGASIAHAHSQIIALPLIPPTVDMEATGFDEYRRHHQTCPICDIAAWEKIEKARVIAQDKHVIAIAPYAGTAPFGVWIIPKQHQPSFADLSVNERRSIAKVLKQVCTKLDEERISFNFFLQNSLPAEDHHFVLKVEPRPNVWGGLELSTGVVVNPVPPEYAAKWYRGEAE